MGNIGLQLYSIKDAAKQDLLGVLEKTAKMGYQGVQFAGFFEQTAKDVKKKMDEVGLRAAGAHVSIELLQNALDEQLNYHDMIDNKLLICPSLPENMRTTADDYKRTAELFNHVGEKVSKEGFSFGYHNHAFEFEQFDGKTGFDILYENTDPNYVKMELDCFWAAYKGCSPIEIVKKYADRCVSLHIKDMKMDGDQPVSTEIGNGTLDIGELIQAGKENKVDWFVVEQEDFTGDPMDSAAQNATVLKEIINQK